MQQLVVIKQLEELLPVFASCGIQAVLLKGVALWSCVYGAGERRVVDIDLLVAPRDRGAAGAVMRNLGYRRTMLPQRPATDREYYNQSFHLGVGRVGLPVELHTSLGHSRRFDFDLAGVFARAESCNVDRAAGYRLSVEDNLLHLAIHRSMHAFDRDTRNTEDAHRLVEAFDVDWSVLVERARAWGCAGLLWILLESARMAFSTAIPDEAIRSLRVGWSRQQLVDRLLEPSPTGWRFRWPNMASWPKRLLVAPLAADRAGQQLRFASYYAWLRARDLWEANLRPVVDHARLRLQRR